MGAVPGRAARKSWIQRFLRSPSDCALEGIETDLADFVALALRSASGFFVRFLGLLESTVDGFGGSETVPFSGSPFSVVGILP